ncbi:hypothetical protein Sjap_007039 [Stephania japonica]|uniref:Uncharacterized protein n=1 Tax=Stephania japonica TaxID=461633 RepID=A0AAP0K6Y5_9MAGN
MKAILRSVNRIRSPHPLFQSVEYSIPKVLSSQSDERQPIKSSSDLFRECGCSESEVSRIFHRQPSLLRTDLGILESKLTLLKSLGLTGSDLVKIINCRPRFLATRIGRGLDDRIGFLESLFGSRQTLLKAIIRNPSLLNYDLNNRIRKTVSLYEDLGVGREDLVLLLLSRPTLIPRSSLNDDKLDYIAAPASPPTPKCTISNLERFGFSNAEVMGLFGRSPFVLTLSVDKVQRNMTFVIGTMKLAARLVLDYPFLLYNNLESLLRPRFMVAERIRLMGLQPQIKGPVLFRALRMTESRFVKAFLQCHGGDVGKDLMQFYANAKRFKRLAVASKKPVNKGCGPAQPTHGFHVPSQLVSYSEND